MKILSGKKNAITVHNRVIPKIPYKIVSEISGAEYLKIFLKTTPKPANAGRNKMVMNRR